MKYNIGYKFRIPDDICDCPESCNDSCPEKCMQIIAISKGKYLLSGNNTSCWITEEEIDKEGYKLVNSTA